MGRQFHDRRICHEFLPSRQLSYDVIDDGEWLAEECHRSLGCVAVRPEDEKRAKQKVAVVALEILRLGDVGRTLPEFSFARFVFWA